MIMATDLPNRPKPDPDEAQTIINPQDRLKSAQDKPDPRFEAARQKAEREAKVYADRAERDGEPTVDEGTVEEGTVEESTVDESEASLESGDDTAEPTEKGSFSFNMTAGDAEEDR
jgi:hypothetical protein